MRRREILTQDYPTSADRLWGAVKVALTEVDGLTLQTADDSQRTATFQTGMTWTSWGQNIRARVQAQDEHHARLEVNGQLRSTFLSSGWGESLHERSVLPRLKSAIDVALAKPAP